MKLKLIRLFFELPAGSNELMINICKLIKNTYGTLLVAVEFLLALSLYKMIHRVY